MPQQWIIVKCINEIIKIERFENSKRNLVIESINRYESVSGTRFDPSKKSNADNLNLKELLISCFEDNCVECDTELRRDIVMFFVDRICEKIISKKNEPLYFATKCYVDDDIKNWINQEFSKHNIKDVSFYLLDSYDMLVKKCDNFDALLSDECIIQKSPPSMLLIKKCYILNSSCNETDLISYTESSRLKDGCSHHTIACDIGMNQQITLLSQKDPIVCLRLFVPLIASVENSLIMNLWRYSSESKEKVFIGGIIYQINDIFDNRLPKVILIVKSVVIKGQQQVTFSLFDTFSFRKTSYCFCETETVPMPKDCSDWCFHHPHIVRVEDCFFANHIIYDEIKEINDKLFIYKRVYDILGNLIQDVSGFKEYLTPQAQNIVYSGSQSSPTLNQMDNTVVTDWSFYIGYVSDNNIPDYFGLYMDREGNVSYVGELTKGIYNGVGTLLKSLFMPPNRMISCNFKDGIPSQQFVMKTNASIPVFDGEIVDYNKILVKGKLLYHSAIVFEGILQNWKPKNGTLYFLSGSKKYHGPIINGMAEGDGVLYYLKYLNPSMTLFSSDKDITRPTSVVMYEGKMKKGRKCGRGKLFLNCEPKTLVYDGYWEDDLYEGNGILYLISSVLNASRYMKLDDFDIPQMKEIRRWKCDNWFYCYEGMFHKGRPCGEGRLYFDHDRWTETICIDDKLFLKFLDKHTNSIIIYPIDENWRIDYSCCKEDISDVNVVENQSLACCENNTYYINFQFISTDTIPDIICTMESDYVEMICDDNEELSRYDIQKVTSSNMFCHQMDDSVIEHALETGDSVNLRCASDTNNKSCNSQLIADTIFSEDNAFHSSEDNEFHSSEDNEFHSSEDNEFHSSEDNAFHSAEDNAFHSAQDNAFHSAQDNAFHSSEDEVAVVVTEPKNSLFCDPAASYNTYSMTLNNNNSTTTVENNENKHAYIGDVNQHSKRKTIRITPVLNGKSYDTCISQPNIISSQSDNTEACDYINDSNNEKMNESINDINDTLYCSFSDDLNQTKLLSQSDDDS